MSPRKSTITLRSVLLLPVTGPLLLAALVFTLLAMIAAGLGCLLDGAPFNGAEFVRRIAAPARRGG